MTRRIVLVNAGETMSGLARPPAPGGSLTVFVLVFALRLARREIVKIRQCLVRRVIVERIRAAAALDGNRTAWLLVFALLQLLIAALGFGIGTKIATACRRWCRAGLERPRTEPRRRARTEAARSWTRRSTRAWCTRPAVFAGARLADRQRTAVEDLTVEFLNGLLGLRSIEELDERESAGPAGLSVYRQHDVRRRSDGAEVGSEVSFSCAVGQVSDKQANRQSILPRRRTQSASVPLAPELAAGERCVHGGVDVAVRRARRGQTQTRWQPIQWKDLTRSRPSWQAGAIGQTRPVPYSKPRRNVDSCPPADSGSARSH
jgi:hypothetical protein